MNHRFAIVAGAVAGLLASTSALAQDSPPPPSSAAADAEVVRLQAALRNAERAAADARAADAAAARNEIEAANRHARQARVRQVEAGDGDPGCPAPPLRTQNLTADELQRAREDDAKCRFGGLEFGGGISYTVGSGRHVTSAQVVNGIVRVSDVDNGRARLVLESHYLFTPNRSLFGLPPKMWGFGPFVAIQPGENNVINAIGAGFMIGFRRKPDETQSFNLGVGVIVDPNTRLLGHGIVADQPLPVGETEVRYRETARAGLLLMASFAF